MFSVCLGYTLNLLKRYFFREYKMAPGGCAQADKKFVLGLVIRLLIFISIVLTIVVAYMSRTWGIVWDAAVSHYVAWLISQGSVPYRDIFDFQFPGTYFIHFFVIQFIGGADIHWRLFDLSCLVVINIFIVLYCRPFGRLSGWVGVALFSAFHLYNGPLYIGQRDYLVLVFTLPALYCLVRRMERGMGVALIAGGGLLLGCAVSIKPYVVLLCFFLLVIFVTRAIRAGGSWFRDSVVLTASCSFVPVVLMLWLWRNDGLAPFLDILFNYSLPFFSKFVFQQFTQKQLISFLGIPYIEIATVAFVSLVFCFKLKEHRLRCFLPVVGMVYGFFHFYLQVRNSYQLYPLVLFMFLCIASWTSALRRSYPAVLKCTMALVLAHVCLLALYRTSICLIDPPAFHITKFKSTQMLKADLKDKVGRDQTVQVMDFLSGMVHGLYELELRQPTRFLFDLQFFHDIDQPYIQSLRLEFLKALREDPPAFFVLSTLSWPIPGYERLDAFPELAAWLSAYYRIETENDYYRIYRYEGMQ